MLKSLLPFTLCVLALGCGQGRTTEQTDPRRDIAAVLERQVQCWNAGDIEGYMQGYWKSDSVRFVSGKGITSGWKQTLERYKRGYPSSETMGRLRFNEVDIDMQSDSSAVVLGRWELKRAEDAPWGYFMLLMKQKAQGWCVVLDHTSSAAS
jgi:ketosteroid isomerase-like protein